MWNGFVPTHPSPTLPQIFVAVPRFASAKNTPSTASGLELTDGGGDSPRGCRGSKRLPCTDLEREERVRDERLVLDLCGRLQIPMDR